VLTYIVQGNRLELTASGAVLPEESAAVFTRIRNDPQVPNGSRFLLDLRDYDHSYLPLNEVGSRVMRMADMLGPKLGKLWAIVVQDEIEQIVKVRLAQHLIDGATATITLFRDLDEAREWLDGLG
jgi:hypothetical protein